MDTQDIRTLKILEEIDQDQPPSQRDLATTLNVSLGLVNSFIKRLAKKGLFKVTTIPTNRVRYILTPKGAAEKTRLTYEYIFFSIKFYQETSKKLLELLQKLESGGTRRIIFLGAGEISEMAYSILNETGIQLVGVLDDTQAGRKFHGLSIYKLSDVSSLRFDKIVVTGQFSEEMISESAVAHDIDVNKFINLSGVYPT